MQKYGLPAKGVKAGGFDLTEQTQKLLQEGNIEFTIDQQPYLQGFLPVLQLFLWHVSGSLTGPAETDTGLKFLNKETVAPYVESKTRYEGTSSRCGRPDQGRHARVGARHGERGAPSSASAEDSDAPRRSPRRSARRASPSAAALWRERDPRRCARAASSSSRSSWRSTSR